MGALLDGVANFAGLRILILGRCDCERMSNDRSNETTVVDRCETTLCVRCGGARGASGA